MQATVTGTGTDTAVDGRRLRRDRNRDAVVDAMLALYHEGNLAPSTDEVASRAGLSPRSLFRYFDDVGDLAQAAITRQQERIRHLLHVDAQATDPLAHRVDALVAQRARMFEEVRHVATVSRLRAPFNDVVARNLTSNRALLRRQLSTLFANQLASMPAATAAARLAGADVATSFEAWQLLRGDQGLSRARATSAMVATLGLLVTP